MPTIASHHAKDPWRPLKAWPDACMVQWGRHGVVFGKTDTYATGFFEAFPDDGSAGFIRGEGNTLEEAEADAFARYESHRGCHASGGHGWTRARRLGETEPRLRNGKAVPKLLTYTNGGAFCLRCGAFQTVMKEIPRLGAWRDPLSLSDLEMIMSGSLRADPRWERGLPERERAASALRRRRLALRARLQGIDLPDPDLPEHRERDDLPPFAEDAYQLACRKAVVRYYLRHREQTAATGDDGLMMGLFNRVTRRRLDEEADEMAAELAAGAEA